MAEMDGELFMFDSPDLSRDSIGWNTFRPDDFNGIGASDLNDIHDFLIAWTETPAFGTPVHPELVSGTIEQNYDKASSRPYWKWDGITTA
ncbi:hypothetical protein D9M71_742730 [compost metagenome]